MLNNAVKQSERGVASSATSAKEKAWNNAKRNFRGRENGQEANYKFYASSGASQK